MATGNRINGIREILNRGILISLCLSLLVGTGVLAVWQWLSQLKTQEYQVNLVRETLQRDAADLLTSSMLKNYHAVGFQLKTGLASLPLKCAYIELQGERHWVKGESVSCDGVFERGEDVWREEIQSGGMTIGPLVYVLKSEAFPASSLLYLGFGFFALVGSMVTTWAVLIKMINVSILRPLSGLTAKLPDGDFDSDSQNVCDEIVALAARLRSVRTQIAAGAKREEFARVGQMIGHNIETPLLVLEGVDVSSLDPANRDVFRNSLSDIKCMIANLRAEAAEIRGETAGGGPLLEGCELGGDAVLESFNGSVISAVGGVSKSGACTLEHVSSLVEMVVAEKRQQVGSRFEVLYCPSNGIYDAFVRVQRSELRAILFNLLNNSIEAFSGVGLQTGSVSVEVALAGGFVSIRVLDTGPGIDPSILPRLGERGFSVGKNGSGLGIHHAQAVSASWGGRCTIDSWQGVGTCVTVEIPAAEPPSWFLRELEIPLRGQIAVLDDDRNVGIVWGKRFHDLDLAEGQLRAFSQAEDFKTWVRSNTHNALYLVDYELEGQAQNGIGVIEELGIAEQSVLVTGRYDDVAVQKKASWLGLRILPKSLVGVVPLASSEGLDLLDTRPGIILKSPGGGTGDLALIEGA